MAKRDYYEILGLPRNASLEEIKSSFQNSPSRTTAGLPAANGALASSQAVAQPWRWILEAVLC